MGTDSVESKQSRLPWSERQRTAAWLLIIFLIVFLTTQSGLLLAALRSNLGLILIMRGAIHTPAVESLPTDLLAVPSFRWLQTSAPAEALLEQAIASQPTWIRPYRGLALTRLARGDLEGASNALASFHSVARSDSAAQLLRANLLHTLDRPTAALPIYQSLLATLDGQQPENERVLQLRVTTEQIRSAHAFLLTNQPEVAAPYLQAALATEPTNLVALYEQAQLDRQRGATTSTAGAALNDCRFTLPQSEALLPYVSTITREQIAQGNWSVEAAYALESFVAWRREMHRAQHQIIRDALTARNQEEPGTIALVNEALIPDAQTFLPRYWTWATWTGDRFQNGLFFGGVEWSGDLQEYTLRITGVCLVDNTQAAAHAGFSPPATILPGNAAVTLSFFYRTDPELLGHPQVYFAFNEGSIAQQRGTLDLPNTNGTWQHIEHVLHNPSGQDAQLSLNFRSFGLGTTWFARIHLL